MGVKKLTNGIRGQKFNSKQSWSGMQREVRKWDKKEEKGLKNRLYKIQK